MLLLVYPIVISLFVSLKDINAYKASPWLPTLPFWVSNFTYAGSQIWQYMMNTVFVSIVSVIGLLFFSSISAFAFSRLEFPGREQIFFAIIALMMVPGVLTLVPTYMTYNYLGTLNTFWVLILPIVIGGSIGGIFLLRSFFNGLPEDLFEAARLDGCSEFSVYTKICLPLSKPILGTLAIQTILGIFNDLIWPMLTIQNEKLWTISAGIFIRFMNQNAQNVPVSFSGYMIASLPLLILFIAANKSFIQGLTSAGLKL